MASPKESGDGDGDGDGFMETIHNKKIELETVHYLLAAREEFRDQMHLYNEFIEIMLEIGNRSANLDGGGRNFSLENCTTRVRKLLDGRTRLIKGFQDLSEGLTPFHDEPQSLCDPACFLQKMKNCPSVSKNDYEGFLNTLLLFHNKRTMTVDDVFQQVLAFMDGCPELLEEFRSYLPARLARAPLPHAQSSRSPRCMEERKPDVQHCRGDEAAPNFIPDANCSLDVSRVKPRNDKSKVSPREYTQRGREKGKHEPVEDNSKHEKTDFHNLACTRKHTQRGLDFFHRHLKKEFPSSKEVKEADGDVNRVIEDAEDYKVDEDEYFPDRGPFPDDKVPPKVDLSNCPRPTPSYCKLPKNYTPPQSRCWTEMEKSVLNDTLVSVTSGTEGGFKFRTKNQYEENIFRCEEDMFERDILLQRFSTTAEYIKELQANVLDNNMKLEVDKHLTPLHRRCIEQLYEVHGLDMLDALSENTSAALSVILARLNQKVEELSEARLSLNNTWAGIIAKNYYRSLDHRSSSFKQLDIKRMNPKALLAEAEETKKMKMNARDKLFPSVWNTQRPLVPDMVFDYTDLDVHEDIYNIINYASSGSCTSDEQLCKVMMIWKKLIEPLLGVDHELPDLNDNAACEEINEHDGFSKDFSSTSDDAIVVHGSVSVRTSLSVNRDYTAENCSKRNKCNEGYSSHHYFEKEIEEGEFIPDVENAQMDVMLETNMDDEQLGPGAGKLEHSAAVAANFDVSGCNGVGGSFQSLTNSSFNSSESGGYAPDSESGEGHELNEDFHNEVDGASRDLRAGCEVYSKGAAKVHDVKGAISFPSAGCSLIVPRPLTEHVPESLHGKKHEPYKIFYGSSSFYVLFRLHQVLYERLLFTRNMLRLPRPEVKRNLREDANLYAKFKKKLCSLLDGCIDNSQFEDYCLSIIGPGSYKLFTLNKLISRIIKQLHKIASSDKDDMLIQLYKKSQRPNVSKELLHYQNAGGSLHEGRIFRFTCSSTPTRLSVELLECEQEEAEKASESSQPKSSDFLYEGFLPSDPEKVMQNHFQRREKRKLENDQESALQSNGEYSTYR